MTIVAATLPLGSGCMRRYDSSVIGGADGARAGYALYAWDIVTDTFRMDATLCGYLGVDRSAGVSGISMDSLSGFVHPADRAGFAAAIETSAQTSSPFKHSFRLASPSRAGPKFQIIGNCFPSGQYATGICTGLVYRTTSVALSTEADLIDHCIAAFEAAREPNSRWSST